MPKIRPRLRSAPACGRSYPFRALLTTLRALFRTPLHQKMRAAPLTHGAVESSRTARNQAPRVLAASSPPEAAPPIIARPPVAASPTPPAPPTPAAPTIPHVLRRVGRRDHVAGRDGRRRCCRARGGGEKRQGQQSRSQKPASIHFLLLTHAPAALELHFGPKSTRCTRAWFQLASMPLAGVRKDAFQLGLSTATFVNFLPGAPPALPGVRPPRAEPDLGQSEVCVRRLRRPPIVRVFGAPSLQ